MLRTAGKKIIVLPLEKQSQASATTTKSGLYLPAPIEDEDVNVIKATVTAIGDEVTKIKENMVVYFHKFDSKKVVFEGKAYYVLQEDSALAIVE